MHPRTTHALNLLEKAPLFSRVGRNDTPYPAVLLSSWAEAMQASEDKAWRSFAKEASWVFRERVRELNPERYSHLLTTLDEIFPEVTVSVRKITHKVMEENHLSDDFFQAVHWDVLNICMEEEFKDVCHPGFYNGQMYYYLIGHFPCGWIGTFPGGHVVIY